MMGYSMKSPATVAMEKNASLREAAHGSSLFETLKNGLKKVTIEEEDGPQEYYVAEGDTLLDEDQLAIYALNRERVEAARNAGAMIDAAGLGIAGLSETNSQALVGVTQGGRHVRWKPGTVLSYRVVRATFTNASRYDQVVEAMTQATGDWMNTAGVAFQHLANLDNDGGVGPGGAVFAVREINANGNFIAAAFFPNDPINRRRILIDPSFFSTTLTFDRVGVLRHELGHVLGFRHEHIRSNAPPACPDEPLFDTENLTLYDPQSVMHYFCGGVGDRSLRITALDRSGSRSIYGPPLHLVEEIEA
jgi:hypothetical protein